MTTTTCTACHARPVRESFLCERCADQLLSDLQAVPDMVHELTVEATRQARRSTGPATSHTRSPEQPLPVNLAAANLLHMLRAQLVDACLAVALRREDLPADTVDAMVEWLITNRASLHMRDNAGDVARGLASVLARSRRMIDNPPERRYIGNCQTCAAVSDDGEGTRMYARMGEAVHRCSECDSEWLVAESLERLEQELVDYGLTHKELETLLPKLPRSTLSSWIDRRQLVPQGTTATGEPAYRYGDVLALDARRRARRKSA